MKILFLSVGKPKQPEASALFEEYSGRIRRIGIHVDAQWVKESDMEREAAALINALPHRCRAIALDRSGTMLDSRQLASRIEEWTTPRGAFIVGGPLGLHSALLDRADRIWSLSSLTFPHDLARAMLSEQIYRALTLVRNIPYHK